MIHPSFNQKNTVNGRDKAGKEMLKIIFKHLEIWTEQNWEKFLSMLDQFFDAYTYPLLHDGMKRPWGLPYQEEQVNVKIFIPRVVLIQAK